VDKRNLTAEVTEFAEKYRKQKELSAQFFSAFSAISAVRSFTGA
jgi:hypothetical protein